jgi:hypothetical protein
MVQSHFSFFPPQLHPQALVIYSRELMGVNLPTNMGMFRNWATRNHYDNFKKQQQQQFLDASNHYV